MSTEPITTRTLGRTSGQLMGREDELAALAARFRAEARVVTLVGPAGVGKSRLALEHVDREEVEGGRVAVVVRLGGLTERDLVVDEILAALPGRAGLAAGPVEALWERCQGDDVLLLLDDVEVGFDAARLVDELVAGYPALRVLATGLRPLRAAGEQVLRVLPFVTVTSAASGEVPPAVLIFAQKAVASDAGFSLGQHNLDDVATICREVGGLPLAIELAASRCAAIPIAVMASQLARPQGIGLLRDDTVAHPDRHSSMELALAWTYGLLTDDERRLLDELSVFEAGFDLEAAMRVTTTEVADTAEMLDRLSGLVDVQLVDLDADDPDSPRFALPRLVRSHAGRRLRISGDDVAASSRHARYFQSRCHRPVGPELLPDILAALDRAVVDGHVDDALHAAVAATAEPARPGAARVLQDRVDELVTRLDGEAADPVLLARGLIRAATGVDRTVEGQTYAEWTAARVQAAVAAARRSGDRHALLEAFVLTVRSLPTTMDAPAAFAAAAEGLELSRELGDDPMIARFELYAGMTAQVRGDVDATVRWGASALRRARAAGDLQTELHSSLLLHRAPVGLLPDDLALPSLEELLATCEQAGEARLGGTALAGLASLALREGDLEAATRWAYRLQLVAADWRLTEPLAATIPIITLVSVAAGRGDLEAGVELHASLERFHSVVTFALTPESLERYEAACAALQARSPADQLALWRQRGAALTLVQAHERGVAYARSVLKRTAGDRRVQAPPPATAELTPREADVLREMASGATNRQIAERLGLSVKTVMHHSVAIYRKLGVRGRGEATAWAFRAGLHAH